MKSICIADGTLYYSDSSVGTLMQYLEHTLGKNISENCDQGRVIFVNGTYLIFGDASIFGSLAQIKKHLKTEKVAFQESSDKNLNPVVKRWVNVLISEEYYDYNPIERSI